jgi:hypothetical protein
MKLFPQQSSFIFCAITTLLATVPSYPIIISSKHHFVNQPDPHLIAITIDMATLRSSSTERLEQIRRLNGELRLFISFEDNLQFLREIDRSKLQLITQIESCNFDPKPFPTAILNDTYDLRELVLHRVIFDAPLPQLPKLNKLELWCCEGPLWEYLRQIRKPLPQLTEVFLHDGNVTIDDLRIFHNASELSIFNNIRLPIDRFKGIFPNLHSLKMDYLSDEDIRFLRKKRIVAERP